MPQTKHPLPVNTVVRYLEPYAWGGRLRYYELRKGRIIDVRRKGGVILYTVDPSCCGHYGHKSHVYPEDVNPTPEHIALRKAEAPIRASRGYAAPAEII